MKIFDLDFRYLCFFAFNESCKSFSKIFSLMYTYQSHFLWKNYFFSFRNYLFVTKIHIKELFCTISLRFVKLANFWIYPEYDFTFCKFFLFWIFFQNKIEFFKFLKILKRSNIWLIIINGWLLTHSKYLKYLLFLLISK